MINLKGTVLAAGLIIGLSGVAMAQVTPGVSGTPGRGNSNPTSTMPNGAAMSNGQTETMGRGGMMRPTRKMSKMRMKRSRRARRAM